MTPRPAPYAVRGRFLGRFKSGGLLIAPGKRHRFDTWRTAIVHPWSSAPYRNSAPICVPRRHFTRADLPEPALREVRNVNVSGTT
jgi:hypothetical protein